MEILSWIIKKIFNTSNKYNDISNDLRNELRSKGIEKKIIKSVIATFRKTHADFPLSDKEIQKIVLGSLYSGGRVESVTEYFLPQFPNLTKKELSKIFGDIIFCTDFNMNKYRALHLCIEWYRWDAYACPCHKHMNNVFVRFDTPPTPTILKDGVQFAHHAGDMYGCKCLCLPLVKLKGIYKPPYKVCIGNEIIKMNQHEFLRILNK